MVLLNTYMALDWFANLHLEFIPRQIITEEPKNNAVWRQSPISSI